MNMSLLWGIASTDAENGFVAERSKSKAISYATRITLLRRKALNAFPRLLREYRETRDQYSSFEYWENIFEQEEKR